MLQRSSHIPLYHQLKLLLVDRIQRGEWRPGELIPGEHELQDIYKLSRTTVRQAMQDLEREGFVTRHRGRGTFVAPPRPPHTAAPPPASVTHELLAQGITPGWRVLAAQQRPAPPDVAARLQLPVDAPVFTTRRLRLADGRPLGYLEANVPATLLEAIDPELLATGGSLDYLRARGLLKGSQTERTLVAAAASEVEAGLLELPVGAPVLKIHRVVIGADGRPVEDYCGTFRGDRLRYRVSPTHEPA